MARTLEERAEQAQHLIAIRETPSWPIVRGILEARVDHMRKRYESPEKLDEHDLNYTRGHISGLRYVLDVIENGDKQLAKAIAEAKEAERVG